MKRLVKIGAGVIRRHASAEADAILRHRRVIDRRHPEPASPQLVAESIHAAAIADDERHDVRRRRAGFDAELVHARAKIRGVFPKPRPQFRFARRNFEAFQNRGHHRWRQRARVDIGVRIEAQVIHRLLRAGDETTERAERFRKRPVNQRDPMLRVEMLGRAASIRAARQHGVSFVDHDRGIVFFRHRD